MSSDPQISSCLLKGRLVSFHEFLIQYSIYNYKEIKVKNDHRSKFSNLSNWKEEA